MATDQLDPRITERNGSPSKGPGGFGLDFFVRTRAAADAEENRGAVGEFFWDGYPSMLFWVDPRTTWRWSSRRRRCRSTARCTTTSARRVLRRRLQRTLGKKRAARFRTASDLFLCHPRWIVEGPGDIRPGQRDLYAEMPSCLIPRHRIG